MGTIKKLHSDQDPDYQARLPIAMQAFESGCIIFSPDTQKWYTPREFVESKEKVVFKEWGNGKHHNFVLHYAKFALEKKLSDLQKAEKEFHDFMTRFMTAFELHPKGKKTKKPG